MFTARGDAARSEGLSGRAGPGPGSQLQAPLPGQQPVLISVLYHSFPSLSPQPERRHLTVTVWSQHSTYTEWLAAQ